MQMEASLNINLDKAALCLSPKVPTPLRLPFTIILACVKCATSASPWRRALWLPSVLTGNGNGIDACVCVCV